ncbi:MAG: intracellular protease, PfpI family [Candidatus Saccharibacteria bacterium]|nr:intracellular protease, PfpI family [Candidatus Saccharibacteria bacterium]
MADLSGKHIAMLVHDFFEQAEYVGPKEKLEAAGATVHTITATDQTEVHGLNHVEKADTFPVDLQLDSAQFTDYDALVLPGGAINADNLRMTPKAREWVKTFLDEDKPVAAVCHAPWLLASADVINGRQLTSFFTIQDDLRNAGATWTDESVVTDGSLITSRNPDDVPVFSAAIIDMLGKGDR